MLATNGFKALLFYRFIHSNKRLQAEIVHKAYRMRSEHDKVESLSAPLEAVTGINAGIQRWYFPKLPG